MATRRGTKANRHAGRLRHRAGAAVAQRPLKGDRYDGCKAPGPRSPTAPCTTAGVAARRARGVWRPSAERPGLQGGVLSGT